MGKRLVNDRKNGIHVVQDNVPELLVVLRRLSRDEVLAGFPQETTERDDPESRAAGITNATLAYIHDNGAPEARIPARPFMLPAMQRAAPKVTKALEQAARYALSGRPERVREGFERAGMAVVAEIRSVIREGIAPPLADSTLRARAKKGRKGAQRELDRRAQGLAPGMRNAVPLIDTAEMLKSSAYVVRQRSAR